MIVDFTTPLTGMDVLVAALFAIGGAIGHEAAHLLAFWAQGIRPRISLGWQYLGIALRPPSTTTRWRVAIAALAPLPWAVLGTWWFVMAGPDPVLAVPLATGEVLILAGWLAGAMPSPGDVYTLLVYRPEPAASGVSG